MLNPKSQKEKDTYTSQINHPIYNSQLQPALLLVLSQRLSRESTKVRVQRINGTATLDELHSAGNMTVRAGDDNTALGWVEAQLLVGRKISLRDTDIGDIISVDVVVVVTEDLRHGVHVHLSLLGGVDHIESEILGMGLVTLKEGHLRDIRSPVDRQE